MTTDREAFTAGLRAVADFLDAHPDLPTPRFPDVTVIAPNRETVDRAAAVLTDAGVVLDDAHGHHSATVRIGAVEYRVVSIDRTPVAA